MNFNYMTFKTVITGIESNEASTFQIYPNPFTAEGLHVEASGIFEYKISDVSGKIIEKCMSENSKLIGGQLSSGVYFLTLEFQYKNEVFKVIKY